MRQRVGCLATVAALLGCASSDVGSVVLEPDASASDVSPPLDAPDVLWPSVDVPPLSDVPASRDVVARCGDGLCQRATESCVSCPLDCDRCPPCDMAPSCTGALAVPLMSSALPSFNNSVGDNDRTSFVCGAGIGAAPGSTTCADPQLRIRVKEISIRRGFFDVPRNLFCFVSAEDGAHAELLLITPREAAGNNNTTRINLPPSQGLLWGQGGLYRSTSNLTISYACFLASNGAAAQRVLDDIAGRAGMVAEHADGYGWVFGTVAVLGTIIGSAIGTMTDTQILDVQQTISADALLTMTNGHTWEIRGRRGNLSLSGASDLRITLESWGCADLRVSVP